MTVRELIGAEVISIRPDQSLREAARAMKANDTGSVAVVIGPNMDGILTERDILNACAVGADLESERVDAWMSSFPDTVEPDTQVEVAAMQMTAGGYRHLPIVEDERLIGMVSIKDLLWVMTGPSME